MGLVLATAAWCISVPPVQKPLRDDVRLMDASGSEAVRQVCNDLKRDTTAELAVLIVRSTGGENQHDFALRTFNQWGIGRNGVDNGVLILFAIGDRRVEIIPGTRYKSHFTSGLCSRILQEGVIPKMRTGKAAEGVIAAVREVAAQIRTFEHGSAPAEQKFAPNRKGAPAAASRDHAANPGNRPLPSTAGGDDRFSGSPHPSFVSRGGRLLFVVLLCAWIAFGGYFFYSAFYTGSFIVAKWTGFSLLFLGGIMLIGLGIAVLQLDRNPPDQLAAFAGVVGLLSFLFCGTHICPKCNSWLSVTNRTIHAATYCSSGLGEQTQHCDNCLYHNVSTYTISRKEHHHSSSRHSSGSSGGRSSGGGGGASW